MRQGKRRGIADNEKTKVETGIVIFINKSRKDFNLVVVKLVGPAHWDRGIFGVFRYIIYSITIQYCFICRTSDSIKSADAGFEPRAVAKLALAARRSL